MKIDDNYILKEFWSHKILNINKKSFTQEIKDYLKNRFKDTESYKESIYRIKYHIQERPKCKYCGNKVKFIGKINYIFQDFCSKECKHNSGLIGKHLKETKFKRYGNENYINIEKWKLNWNKKSKEEINKIILKRKETCLNKYGYDNPFKNPNLIKKIHSKEILNKQNETKLKNNTINTSKPEEKIYKLLKNKYSDIKRQYKSDLYPFNCDFYIPSLDLYIEYNGHWTHGFKPYEGTKEDLNKINIWKSKNTNYYNRAIISWTKKDVYKRNIAKQNNLNYLEFFSLQEIYNWLNNEN